MSLDITFANLYFDAVDAAERSATVPMAWRQLFECRNNTEIEPIQFALAGMIAHINHDLPLAVASTCTELGTDPSAGQHLADYQKVDTLLDDAEQSVRRSFETNPELAVDRHLAAVANLVGNWSINVARDLAWTNSLVLWQLRDDPAASSLFAESLALSASMAGRLLLVAV